jgi:hypothetical protein
MTVIFGESLLAFTWSLAPLIAGVTALWFHQWVFGGGLAAVGLVMTVLSAWRTTVFVGAEGISIRWLAWQTFIPFDSLHRIDTHKKFRHTTSIPQRVYEFGRGVLIRHSRGETFVICDDAEARDLVGAVTQRRADHRSATSTEVLALHRGERPIADWVKSVRALLSGGGYRSSSATPDAFWQVLESSKSAPDERAAAAIALRTHLGEEARPRLRVVIDSCAEPKLRVALEAIDEGDDAATDATMKRLAVPDER